MKPVSDPTILQQLNQQTPGLKPVTDSDLLNQLEGKPAESWTDNIRDPIAGALKIGPTALKGVADLARLITGDRVGVDTSEAMQRGMKAIDEVIGSERLLAQKANINQALQDKSVGITDLPGVVVRNPRAALDVTVSTVGSMFLPAGVAAGAVKALPVAATAATQLANVVPAAAKILPTIAAATPGAVATGASVVTGAAQNAAETFADTAGQDMADRYKGAGISGAASLILGKLLGGGAEGVVARRLAGETGARGALAMGKSAVQTGGKEFLQETGEESSNYVGKQVAKDEAIDPSTMGKQGLYGGMIGFGMGGASDVATNIGNVGKGGIERQIADAIDQAAQEVADRPTPQTVQQTVARIFDRMPTRPEPEPAPQPAPGPLALGFDSAVRNPDPVLVADDQGNVRPMSPDEQFAQQELIKRMQDMGLTPDVQRAIQQRQQSPEPAAPSTPQDLIQRLMGTGWQPTAISSQGITPNPDSELVGALGQDFERLFQGDVKDEIRARLASQPKTETQPKPAPAQAPAITDETADVSLTNEGKTPILQNRNRATQASISQMQSIAANPDYGRLGFSRDFANGAPVVAGGQIAPERLGKTDVAVASDGRRIPVQYAVVEAADVLTSNRADGTPNASYGNQDVQTIRAIAGNGRIAGLQAAYGQGTSQNYINELTADTLHGVNPAVIRGMRAPVLVRVMPQEAVTNDIGDVSNTTGNLNLSAVEQANNDAQRVNLEALQFAEDGGITAETVRQFVRAMPQAEQGGLLDTNGQPTKQAVDRINAAVFAKAYGNDQLVRLFAQAQDPEARLILSALAQLAPKMARLEGAGALDLRDIVTQAAEVAVNARRNGVNLQRAAQQIDMTTDPLVGVVLDLFARNPRSNKPVVESLGNMADLAYTEATKPTEDMFGTVPRASRGDVINTLRPQDEQASQENLEQPAGREPVQVDAGRTEAQPAAAADPGPAQASGTTEADNGILTGYTPQEIEQRLAKLEQAEKERQQQDREAEQRAQADAQRDDFTLTGSNRDADVAAARGQRDIFSAPAEDTTQEAQPEAAPAPRKQTTASKIEDFGEKIGGARKDVWTSFKDQLGEIADDDIANQPLSKIWPQPDYQALLDGGADQWTVAFAHAARDEIPTKPRQSWKLKRWSEQVRLLRDTTKKLMDGSLNVERAKQLMYQFTSQGLRNVAGRVELYMLVGHRQSLDGVRLSSGEYSVHNGIEYKPAKVIWTVEKEAAATAFSNWPRQLATGFTKEEALQAFKAKYDSLNINPAAKKEVTFDIYSKRGQDGYFIGKKVGRNYIDLAGPFENVKAAREHKATKQAELVATLEKAKEVPQERRDTNEPRVGEDMRNGQDVTPQMFGETFGFRGVEFGNWVEQGRRQKDLNDAFDALMDMAAVLDIPPKAISLNGELGLAFGARGGGGVNPAAAHYEPTKVVINLTKKSGAGSLGHEWWHALDNYFSRMRAKSGDMMTDALDVSLASRGSPFEARGAVRREMIEAFGQVMKSIKETAIKARSAKLDAKRSKEYWTTDPEMSARAFESYLISKLQDQDASNDYLANIVDPETWKAAEAIGFELEDSYPYPTAGEIPAIRAGFDHFFQTIETRETDKGVMLYDITGLQKDGPISRLPEAARANVLAKLKALEKRMADGKISDVEYRAGVQSLIEQIEQRNETRLDRSIIKGRERGPDWITERLIRAKRKGELDPDTVDFAVWALAKNPALAEDLGISVREQPESQRGAAGDYNPASRVMRLFKDAAQESTAVHEILHHTERMMPTDVQNGILKAYQKAWDKAHQKGDEKTRESMRDMLLAQAGDNKAMQRVRDAFADGSLKYKDHYQLYNASEFWAVNASDILAKRYAVEGSWVGNAKRWLSEMLQYVKNALGLASDAPVLRGLLAVLNGTGERLTDKMLSGRDDVLQQMDTPAFKRWFGDSKVVNAEGMPLVMYHGTMRDFDAFDPEASPATENTGTKAIYVSPDSNFSNQYAEGRGGNVMPVFVKAENPFDFDNERHIAALQEYEKANRYTDRSVSNYVGDVKRGWWEAMESRKVQAAIKAMGHDGFYLIEEGVKNLGVYDPAQIKSATGNNGEFNPSNPSILSDIQRPSERDSDGLQTNSWTVPEPGTFDNAVRAIQNNKIDLKRVRDAITERYGNVRTDADAYLNEELYHGKVAARVEALHKESVEPILAKIAVAGKNAGVTMDDVNLYLHARHAPERNAAMKAINPDMKNNEALSGMSDQEAAKVMRDFTAAGKDKALAVIARDVDQLLNDTRTGLVADGLEDAGVVQAWESAYKHYVPLQRDIGSSGTPKGMGFSVRGPESKRAVGSNKEVVNILANIVTQAETAAIRAEKATVGRSLLAMARQYPNPKFWKVDIAPTKPRINKDTGLVERNAVDPLYQTADNVIMVKDYGQEHFIVFNQKNERAVAVAKAMKNLDIAPMNKILEVANKGTRFLASLLTQRNPLFWLTNFARDIQGAMLNLEGTDAEGLQREVMGNLPKAFKGMHALVRGEGKGQWARYANDMKEAGGTTGYMQAFENSDARMKDLEKEVAKMQQGKADPRRLARMTLEFVDDYNDIIENAVRLSVFQAARDNGVSTTKAASIAKNITVNFNRKGNLTPPINALYMFFNASVQGTARLAQSVLTSKTAAAAVGGIAIMGFLLDALNRAMSDDDEETGRNRYDLIPEFDKSKNWIIMNPMRPGEYVKVPLPLGPHVFHNAGRLLSDAVFRDDPRNAAEYGWSMAGVFLDAFSPLGAASSVGQLIAPSVLDPVLQVTENKSFTGAPVYKSADRFGKTDPKPAYTRYFESTPDVWKGASRMLNDVSGGDKDKPGAINLEPDILKHVFYTMTGGPGRTLDQAIDATQAGARGKDLTVNRVPLASRFYGANDDQQRERVYYDDRKRAMDAKTSFDHFMKIGRQDLAKEVAAELGDGDVTKGRRMMMEFSRAEKSVRKINGDIRKRMESSADDEAQAEQLRALRKRRVRVMSDAVNDEE